jgi:ABC-2 type transport system permease protein
MNIVLHTIRLGIKRGWIETKIVARDPQALSWTAIIFAIFLGVLWFQRTKDVNGISLALLTLPSLLGMQIASSGFSDVATQLSFDREDGTLLRAKAVPRGISAYFVARVTATLLTTTANIILLLIPSMFIVDGLMHNVGFTDILLLGALIVMGLLATAPFGAVIGSIVKSSGTGWGLTILPFSALVTISGIFYPITAMAGWVQVVAQVFPVYWLALGVRSVFSPESAAAVELTGSWRSAETFLILGGWAILGMFIAPRIVRRMTRRTSGSEMEAGRQRTSQRGY